MFLGRYEHTIDEKGRISIPAKFREILKVKYDERLVITTMDGCLYAYPHQEWKEIEEKASNFDVIKPEDRQFMRIFFSGAMECIVDKLGRIVLPPTHREYAGIVKDVIFAGMLKRIEIWSKERFEERIIKPSLDASISTAISEMASRLGI
ncbi:MAG: division/cell wall cluster transcriptional repressor MraZ [Proteobacteria bacterium]|nr:division/cell wall cluster transcriptional repressor MraZ [Pseudomonadota bacterium]